MDTGYTRVFNDRIKRAATNKGFASGGSNVNVRHFFVYLSFVARSEFSAENPARTQSPEPLHNKDYPKPVYSLHKKRKNKIAVI